MEGYSVPAYSKRKEPGGRYQISQGIFYAGRLIYVDENSKCVDVRYDGQAWKEIPSVLQPSQYFLAKSPTTMSGIIINHGRDFKDCNKTQKSS